jgi:hypothetical protein
MRITLVIRGKASRLLLIIPKAECMASFTVVLQEIGREHDERDCVAQMFLGCHSEQPGDECNLSPHITFCYALQLPFPDHVHHLEAPECSPSSLKREKTHSWDVSTV